MNAKRDRIERLLSVRLTQLCLLKWWRRKLVEDVGLQENTQKPLEVVTESIKREAVAAIHVFSDASVTHILV